MVPDYWLTEGGQSATGALLDYIIENHVASPRLANRAASQSKILFTQFIMNTSLIYSVGDLYTFCLCTFFNFQIFQSLSY